MSFEKALAGQLKGEFNRSSGSDGAEFDDLSKPLHIRTDRSGRIVAVRGSQLRINGKVVGQVGQKSSLRTQKYATPWGQVNCRVGTAKGRVQALQLEWVGP
jgi:hypothetical protein